MNAKSETLKCGVAGVGYLGQHHARIYSELPQCELIGVYDVDQKRAKHIAEQYGTRSFENLDELAQACEAMSVVVPTDKHHAVSLKLLDAGCHLLIEKPLCTNLQEAEEILSHAQAKDLLVQVGHIEHYNPVMSFLEDAVKEPRYITADRLAPFDPRGTEVGVVLDLMIHDIGIILQLVKSPIAKIESIGVNVLSKTEDIANARISFENGCVANINTSRVSLKKVREIRVFQPNTYLSLDFMNQKGHFLKRKMLGLDRQTIPIEQGEPLLLELSSFVDCVKHRVEPKVGGAFGKTALEVAIQITEEIAEKQMAMKA